MAAPRPQLGALEEFIALPSSDDEEEPPPPGGAAGEAEAADADADAPGTLAGIWAPRHAYAGSDAFLGLHEEVLDFWDAFSATASEHAERRESIELLGAALAMRWPGAEVVAFGSFASGLYLPTSDVDVAVRGIAALDGAGRLSTSETKRVKERVLREVAQLIRDADLAREDADAGFELEVIASARVPIIRFVDETHLLSIDLTLDSESGEESTELMRSYARTLPAFRYLVLVLKLWLQRRGLHETYNGGVGSFLLQLMVAASLQLNPLGASRSTRAVGGGAAAPPSSEHSLGSALLDFFELYGLKLNYRTAGVSLRHGCGFFAKASRPGWLDRERPHMLALESPLDRDVDVGKGAYNIGAVRRAFSQSYFMLRRAMDDSGRAASRAGGARAGGRVPLALLGVIYDDGVRAAMAERFERKFEADGTPKEPPLSVPPPPMPSIGGRGRLARAATDSDGERGASAHGADAAPARQRRLSAPAALGRGAAEWLGLETDEDEGSDDEGSSMQDGRPASAVQRAGTVFVVDTSASDTEGEEGEAEGAPAASEAGRGGLIGRARKRQRLSDAGGPERASATPSAPAADPSVGSRKQRKALAKEKKLKNKKRQQTKKRRKERESASRAFA